MFEDYADALPQESLLIVPAIGQLLWRQSGSNAG